MQVIFVLVSDIGVADMEQVMIQYETREEIPTVQLERVVKSALDDQWKRLDFGKMIDQVWKPLCARNAWLLLTCVRLAGHPVPAFRAPAHCGDHRTQAETAGRKLPWQVLAPLVDRGTSRALFPLCFEGLT
jgi:hypothetical protein